MPLSYRALVAAALCCATSLSAQSESNAALSKAIDSIAASYLKDGKAAGMSIAVMRGKDTLALRGYGFADLELDVPTPARAVYEIGSVTKQFTAAALLSLRDEGKLDLDDEVTKYLPNYPTQGHRITVRRLLDHTSGIKGYTELPKFGAIMPRKLPKDSLLALFQNEPFDFAPGDGEVYNNSAYFLAGLIIEKVAGKPYADVIKERLFDKVGMSDSRYCSESAIIKRKVKGYDTGPAGLANKGFIDHTYPFSAGSLCSTVGDLLAWNRALHGGKVVSARAYADMITPGTLNDGTKLRYGKGLAMHHVNGHRVIEHGGGINGFLSASDYFPDDDLVVVVLVNSTGPVAPGNVVASIVDRVAGKKALTDLAYPGKLDELAGTYAGVGRGAPMRIKIAVDNGKLTLAALRGPNPTGAPLRYIGNDSWERESARYTFVRTDGKVTSLRSDQVYGYSVLERQP